MKLSIEFDTTRWEATIKQTIRDDIFGNRSNVEKV